MPVLWDNERHVIVNNESEDIVRMLNGAFNAFAAHPAVDLCPADRMPLILETNAWVYSGINNGVYKCGFAKTQVCKCWTWGCFPFMWPWLASPGGIRRGH